MTRISTAAAKVDRLEAEKVSLQTAPKPTHEGRVEAPPTGSPFEQYVSGYSPRAQAWLRAHPDCVPESVPDGRGGMIQLGGDSTKNSKMMAGHYAAKAQRVPEGSDEYFRIIEEHIGDRDQAVSAAPVSSAAAVTAARSATPKPAAPRPAAPVSREPPSANGSTTQRRVSLSLEQQETAMFSYPAAPGESEDAHRKRALGTYAREYLKAKAEGKIGRLSH